MKTIFIIIIIMLILGISGVAWGTTYYVSSSLGNDLNSGTSAAAAWKTMAKVNGATFSPGDSILLRRGDVWNESLVPPSSGASGNPITFDAYGTGAPPNLTGYYAVPSSAWINLGSNAWKAPVPATYTTINFCLFGSVWGQRVSAVTSNLTAEWDFFFANGYLYVYATSNPATYYTGGPIVPMGLSNVPVINVNGKAWLTFQHILVNWFDQYGVYVQGTSDHLVFANMESDSMIPQGTQPLGFYVNESTPGPGDIKIYNAEAHMNYDGFRFDGTATAITMVNDKAYANRDGALVDNTSAVTYSYCHFYASSLAVAGSTDVESTTGTGAIAGAGNIAADVAPAVQAWQRYPARVTLTVDDAGMTPGADTYYGTTVAPIADSVGVPVGAAITVGYPLAQTSTLISEFQGWINAGRDVTAHSISHTYYTNLDALDIQYTGTGTAAVLSISGKTLTITVTGAADSVSYNLGLATGQSVGTGVQTMLGLQQALTATGHFTATFNPVCQGPYGTGCSYYTNAALLSQDLADVTSQNVKSSVYAMQLNVTRLTTDEISLSRLWMTSNLTGLPTPPVYVYPGGYENPNMEAISAGVPYTGARGALHEGGTDNTGLPITGVKDTYATGFDVQNITSFGVNPSWMGLTPASLNQKIQALVWKQMVWGVPWGVFWHLNELTETDPVGGTEITNLLQDFKNSGATIQTNTGLVNWLSSGTLETGNDGNFYYKSAASSMTLDFRPTSISPVVDAGQNLGAAYQLDINGVNQNSYGSGWEIGAHVFAGYSSYGGIGGSGGSYFSIGTAEAGCGWPTYACGSTSLLAIAYPTTAPSVGGVTGAGTTFVDPAFGTPGVRITDANFDPSLVGTANDSYTVSNGGASDDAWFSTDSKLTFVTSNGSWKYLVGLNPATLAVTRPYSTLTSGCPRSNCSTNGGWSIAGDVNFSQANACEIYNYSGSSIYSYTFGSDVSPVNSCSTGISGPPSAVLVENFIENSPASCVGTACNCLPSDFGTPTWTSEGGTTTGDALFAGAFSSTAYHYGAGTGQGSGYYAAIYSPAKGCMVYNTQTGAMTADPGWAGAPGFTCTSSGCTGTSTAPGNYTLHQVKSNQDGGRLTLQWTTCISGTCTASTPFTWVTGTTTVYISQATKTGGHWCVGESGLINDPGNPNNFAWYYRTEPPTSPSGTPVVLNTTPAGTTNLDTHCGWQMDNSTDTAPFLWTATTASLANWGLLPYDQPAGPWWNEIEISDTNGDGLTHREALTFNTGYSTTFTAANNITTASRSCFAVGSDWFNIRNAGGTSSSCIANGPDWKASFTYATGYVVNPNLNNAANDSFKATVGGAAGSTEPNWASVCATTCTDGGVTWTNIGAPTGVNACGTDAFVWCTQSSAPVLGKSPMFGFTETSTAAGNFPTVSYGMQRIWDSPPLQWPSINTAAGVFNWTNLDTMLAQDLTKGVSEVMYTLARTPPWISSGSTDSTTCSYPTSVPGGGNGECYPPTDLNADGSGTNATWKAWITAIAQHVNNATYLLTHAHVRYWEIWNEPDAQQYWYGTFAQLSRLTEDARCIILGSQGGVNVIHQSGNGTATPCTATPIDSSALIIMSSGHASSASVLTYAQNQLYCNSTAGIPTWQLPCPNPANATAAAVDVLNFHLKPGNSTGNNCPPPSTPCTPETALQTYVGNVRGLLQAAELAKPMWNGEASYAEAGFTNAYIDTDMAASLMPRFYLISWSLGVTGSAWYSWDNLEAEPAAVQTAYQQAFDWLTGAMLTSPCAVSGTVWTCGIVKNGIPYGIMWDASQSCSGGSCTTGNQTVGAQWGHSKDMTTASTPAAISGSTVAVGIKPVVLSQ